MSITKKKQPNESIFLILKYRVKNTRLFRTISVETKIYIILDKEIMIVCYY